MQMLYRVGICGFFAKELRDYGGQPVKTRDFTEALSQALGRENIRIVDTLSWKKRILPIIFACWNLVRTCDNIVILPAANGIKVFAPLFLLLNLLYQRKLHYVVIGGWITSLIEKNPMLSRQLKKFSGIYVETHVMESNLKHMGFENVHYMPNLKPLTPVEPAKSKAELEPVKRFCTFSRVVKEKGIADAIHAVIQVNQASESVRCQLDIYGDVYEDYREEFNALMAAAPDYIVYKGAVSPALSVTILQDYYMQLFPTRYKTEGVPGSVIDSYFAGVPVLASRWDSFDDVIADGETGLGFSFGVFAELVEKIKWALDHPGEIRLMRYACVKRAELYTPKAVLRQFIPHLQ